MSKVQLVWEVEDGYAGKSRPQYTEICMDEFSEDQSDVEIDKQLDCILEGAFITSIYPFAKNKEEVIAAIRRYQEENKGDAGDE